MMAAWRTYQDYDICCSHVEASIFVDFVGVLFLLFHGKLSLPYISNIISFVTHLFDVNTTWSGEVTKEGTE